jgi:hypothetical protein
MTNPIVFDRMRKLATIILGARTHLLKKYFDKWANHKAKNLLKRVFMKWDYATKGLMRAYLRVWYQDLLLDRQRKKMIAIWKMLHISGILDQARMFNAFLKWKNSKPENVWMKKAINVVARHSKINTQVAFWRLLAGTSADPMLTGHQAKSEIFKINAAFFILCILYTNIFSVQQI